MIQGGQVCSAVPWSTLALKKKKNTTLVHSFTFSVIQQIYNEHLLCPRHCARPGIHQA